MTENQKIIIKKNAAMLAQKATTIFNQTDKESVDRHGRFVVAISGGSTPRRMYRMLAEEPYGSAIPWDKTYIFWVDERCVPENDPASNYGAAKKDFLNRVSVPEAQVYPMPGELPPKQGAQKYQKALIDFFHLEDGRFPTFDQIFLGMGADGHTASLFPGQDALDERKRLIVAVKGGNPDVNRLTMTLPVLNRARHIVFLISGKEKAATLKTVFEDDQARFPVQKIHALDRELTWLLDRESASLLPGEMIHQTRLTV
jgi:6-phosphogluconolactonase